MASHRHRSTRLLVLPLLFLVAPLASAQDAQFMGKVVGVIDGDTIDVMHLGKAERVRLYGVDAPEKNQAFGTKAKQFTSEKVFGKRVRVVVKDTDRYGRTVGDVFLPSGKRLSNELVSAGMAWWYKQYARSDTNLMRRHRDAGTRKVGLWADPSPVAPWEFRRRGKSPSAGSAPVRSVTNARPGSQSAGIFVTRTGRRYHQDGCQFLQQSKIPTTMGAAVSEGYTACRVCKPPLPGGAQWSTQKTSPRQAPSRAPPQTNIRSVPQVQQQVVSVFVTNTGKKYHRDGCRYLSKSKIPISLVDAQRRYMPCSVCRP